MNTEGKLHVYCTQCTVLYTKGSFFWTLNIYSTVIKLCRMQTEQFYYSLQTDALYCTHALYCIYKNIKD